MTEHAALQADQIELPAAWPAKHGGLGPGFAYFLAGGRFVNLAVEPGLPIGQAAGHQYQLLKSVHFADLERFGPVPPTAPADSAAEALGAPARLARS